MITRGALSGQGGTDAAEERAGVVRVERAREVEALGEVAAHLLQQLDLLGFFDPLGDDTQAESMCEPYDGAHDRAGPAAMAERGNERPVDLELVYLQPLEVAQ